jgi:flagellar hook protein FlgE
MSFQQGLSGLTVSSKSLDVIGNNIANISTAGFKGSRAVFADVYASSLTGSTALAVGIGSKLTSVTQQFSQGNLTVTSNPLDMAVTGNGFFMVQSTDGTQAFTRNGQFQLDASGYIVNATAQSLVGYPVDPNTGTVSGTLGPIQIAPTGTAKATDLVQMAINLDADSPEITAAINPSLPATYNYSTPLTVYDSLGVAHTMTLYFRNVDQTTRTWSMAGYLDNSTLALAPTAVTFNTDGTIATPATPVTLSAALASGATTPLAMQLDLTGSTQFGSNSGVNSAVQNGRSAGKFIGLQIDNYGLVQGRYDNGQTLSMAQIPLYTFNNPNGLLPVGENTWLNTSASGNATPNNPGSGVAGTIRSGAIEDSNVDLTAELVNLIVAQRTYQANAQTIRAQDQILQTLVNLR